MALSFRPRTSRAQPVVPDAEKFLGDEVVSATTGAGGVATASVPNGARHAYIFNTGSFSVIVRPNDTGIGGDPVAGNGITIAAGFGFDWTGDPARLKFLGVGGTSAVYIAYFGEA